MLTLRSTLALAATFVLTACSAAVEESRAFVALPFDEALAAGKKGGKVVMVDFFATWCGPCKQLDRVTWKDEKVVAWLQKECIALKIDVEKESELAQRFAVSSIPTLVFLRPDGSEIGRMSGFLEPQPFLDAAQRMLEKRGASGGSR